MAKVKGSALAGAVRFLRAQRAKAEPLVPVALLHYLDTDVSSAGWYPEEDLVGLIRVMLRLIPGERDEVLEEMGRATAREHLEGTYAHLIDGGDVRNLHIRAFTLWSAMHDSGKMEIVERGTDWLRLSLSGYGHPSEELCKISRGYVLEVLRLNGIAAEAEKVACAVHGGPACVWDLRWGGEARP